MDFQISIVLLCLLMFVQKAHSRPLLLERIKEAPEDVDSLDTSFLPFKSLESTSLGLATPISMQSNNAVSALTFMTLSYVTYVGANLYFPSVLTTIGIPVLEDFSRERNLRSHQSTSQSFLSSLATDFVTDMLTKTEAAESLRNASSTVIDKSVKAIKRTSKFADDQLNNFQGVLDQLTKALSPGCLSRYMCKAGQFTSLHLPAVAAMMRSMEDEDLDDHGQAFIDGTTIGDCDSVFPHCEAWSND